MTEAELMQHLEHIEHHIYMEKAESQIVRLELRTYLLREHAREAIAAGKITKADVENVRSKWNIFRQKFAELQAASGTSTKVSRSACTHAWDDLRTTLRATGERAEAPAPLIGPDHLHD